MTIRTLTYTCLAAGLVTLVAAPGAPSAAPAVSPTTIEFSAQTQNDKNKKTTNTPRVQRVTPQVRTTPHVQRVTPRVQRVNPQVRTTPRVNNMRQTSPKVIQTHPNRSVVGTPKVNRQNIVTPRVTGQKKVTVFTPRGSKSRSVVLHSRLRNFPAQGAGRAMIGGRNYSVWRSGYRVRRSGGWRTFVGLSALGALAIGAYQYYPYAYISAPEEYCDGLTEDGCQMVFQEVDTMEGDVVPQCVAYCPWQ